MSFDVEHENREFTVTTFDGVTITFRLLLDGTLICNYFDVIRPIKSIDLKPNLTVRTVDGYYVDFDIYARTIDSKRQYIQSIDIDEDLLEELAYSRVIFYSTDMAYLYGLDPKLAFDSVYNHRAFKHVKDKAKVLELQKQGIYN